MTSTPTSPVPHGSLRDTGRLRTAGGDVRIAVALALLGLPAGWLWRVLAERAVASSSVPEGAAAVDSVLALVQLGIGLLVGVLLVVRPGEQPARRFLLVVAGLLVGGGLAWGTGLLLGVRTLGLLAAPCSPPPPRPSSSSS